MNIEEEKEKEISIEDRLIYNNNKLVADKIRKTLLNIRNVPGISARRWIWELIQNAKDVPNKFNRVEIKIELNQNSLKFSHNGSYFTIDNILGILQQISSKDSKNNDDQTGKFGTGFIGTHLLSGKVNIKGIVKYKGSYKRFSIDLDRTANSSEELLKEVDSSINKFKDNMNKTNSEYENIKVYDQHQTDFDTIFEYKFDQNNNQSLKIAQEGLNDLINTAPVTLSTQYKKISSITITDSINNQITEYSHSYRKLKSIINEFEIGINIVTIKNKKTNENNETEEKKYFYSYKTNKCRLLFQVEKKDNETFRTVERLENQLNPILYRDFPLIGSEKFHFPFFLDGFKFNPLETRNGLYLNGELNEEAKENRDIISHAIDASIKFTKWLLENNLDKRYLLAKSQIPEPPQKYDDIFINWFINQQKKWRKELIELRLLKDENGNINELKELKLPILEGKFNMDFYKLILKFNITGGILPNENEVEIWYNILEKDSLKEVYNITINTWNSESNFNYSFNEIDLFKKINDAASIQNLASQMDVDNNKVIQWLNELYSFLEKNNCINYLYQYKIVPNKKGIFQEISKLYGNENVNSVPDIINPIYKYIFGEEINDIMIHQDINLDNLGKNAKKKKIEDILNEFSDVFKKNDGEEKKKYLCNEFISFSINNPKIKKMFEFRSATEIEFKNIRQEKLTNYYEDHIIWREVEDFWFNYHPSLIESKKNINNLVTLLYSNNNDINLNKCKIWLNNYLHFLKENYTKVNYRRIFPNQLGNFENLENLQYDESIPEILKDIYNDLNSTDNERFEIRTKLLLKEIICYKIYNKLTQKEIIGKIVENFQQSQNDVLKTSISERILSFLPNNDTNELRTIFRALREFIPYYNNIYNKNIIQREEKGGELNYVIFLRYLLIKTLSDIERMTEDQIPAKIEIISKIIKFAWKYQDNKFINLSVDPSKYKIFVNQNNKFDKIENIKFKVEIDQANNDDIKNLFELSKLSPIESDFKNNFLSPIFVDNLYEYKNKFRTIKLKEICEEIEYKLFDYFEIIIQNNLFERNDKYFQSFRTLFFKLNDILKNSEYLKKNFFKRFMRRRGDIALKFLDKDDDIDSFIDNIRKAVEIKRKEE